MDVLKLASYFQAIADELRGGSQQAPSVGGFPAPGTGGTTTPPPASGGTTTPPASTPSGDWTTIPLDWANPQRVHTLNYGGGNAGDVIVLPFTTPNVDSGATLCKIDGSENDGYAAGDMYAVLSETPGDFEHPLAVSGPSKSITIDFALGNGDTYGYAGRCEKNKTYYVNVRNMQGGHKSFYLHRANLV